MKDPGTKYGLVKRMHPPFGVDGGIEQSRRLVEEAGLSRRLKELKGDIEEVGEAGKTVVPFLWILAEKVG